MCLLLVLQYLVYFIFWLIVLVCYDGHHVVLYGSRREL
jgi:hypothetical protein